MHQNRPRKVHKQEEKRLRGEETTFRTFLRFETRVALFPLSTTTTTTISMKLRLIGSAQSRAFRCVWMLEELGVPYELIPAMPSSKEAFEHNPSGKIPALVVTEDGAKQNESFSFVVTESAVINTFLGDRFPDSGLVPKFLSRERIVYDQLIMSIMTELDATSLWMHRKHVALGKFFGYIPEIEKASAQEFQRMNGTIAKQLQTSGGPFLLGAQFTSADILYGHCLDWAKLNGWNTAASKSSLSDSVVETYMKTYRARPAYQRAKEIRSQEYKTTPKKSNPFHNKSVL